MSQPMDALAKANKIRKARADLKREIAAGKVSIESILTPGAAIPWELESMPVCKLLTAQRRCGDRRAMVFLRSLGIGEQRPVGALTARQRQAIVSMLRGEPAWDMRILSRPLQAVSY